MLQKSISRMSEDSERWCENTCKLHGRRSELAHVHQVQSAAQTVIGELQICPSAISYLAVLLALQCITNMPEVTGMSWPSRCTHQ